MSPYLYQLLGAMTLDAGVYEGLEADASISVSVQSAATVVLVSLAAAVGVSGLWGFDLKVVAAAVLAALVTWLAWAVLVFEIGTRVLPGPRTHSSIGELLRTTGFAAAPGLCLAFASVSAFAMPVFIAGGVWMLMAMVIAVQHALDFRGVGRAIAVCLCSAGADLEPPAEAIVDYADLKHIDLIIMGTHGRKGLSHLVMGSVAEKVMRTAGCPVLTVKHPERGFLAADALAVIA